MVKSKNTKQVNVEIPQYNGFNYINNNHNNEGLIESTSTRFRSRQRCAMHHAISCGIVPDVLRETSSSSSSSTPSPSFPLVPCYNSILPCEIFFCPKDMDFFMYSIAKPALYFNCKEHVQRTTKWKTSGKLYDWSPDGWNDIGYPIQNVVGYNCDTNVKTHVMRISAIHSKDHSNVLLPIWLVQIRNRDSGSRLGQNSSSDIDKSSRHDITQAELTATAILRHQQQNIPVVLPMHAKEVTETEGDDENTGHVEEYDDNDTPITQSFNPNMIEQLLRSFININNNRNANTISEASSNPTNSTKGVVSDCVQMLNTIGTTFHSIAASIQSTRSLLPFEIENTNTENVPVNIPRIIGSNFLHVTIPAQRSSSTHGPSSPSTLALSTALVSSSTTAVMSCTSTSTSPLLSPMRCASRQSSSTVYSPESVTSPTSHRQLSRNNSTGSRTSPLQGTSTGKFEQLHREASFDDVPIRMDYQNMNSNDGTTSTSKRRRSKSKDIGKDDIMKLSVPLIDDDSMNTRDSVRLSSRNENNNHSRNANRSTTPGNRNRKTPKSTPKSKVKSPGNSSIVNSKPRERASTTSMVPRDLDAVTNRHRFYSDYDMNSNQSMVSMLQENNNTNTNMSVSVSQMDNSQMCISNGPHQGNSGSSSIKLGKGLFSNFTDAFASNLLQPIGQRILNLHTVPDKQSSSSSPSSSSTVTSIHVTGENPSNVLSSNSQSVFKGKTKTSSVRISPKLVPSTAVAKDNYFLSGTSSTSINNNRVNATLNSVTNHKPNGRSSGTSTPRRASISSSDTMDERTRSPCPPNWDDKFIEPLVPPPNLSDTATNFSLFYESDNSSINEVFGKTKSGNVTSHTSSSQETTSLMENLPPNVHANFSSRDSLDPFELTGISCGTTPSTSSDVTNNGINRSSTVTTSTIGGNSNPVGFGGGLSSLESSFSPYSSIITSLPPLSSIPTNVDLYHGSSMFSSGLFIPSSILNTTTTYLNNSNRSNSSSVQSTENTMTSSVKQNTVSTAPSGLSISRNASFEFL